MAKNQTLELSILIGGHVDNSLTQAVKSANTQLSSMANGASKLAANIAKVTVGIASGITAGLVDATKEAVDPDPFLKTYDWAVKANLQPLE